MAFFFLALRALRAKYTATRAVLFSLSAVALTLTVMSRPTVALMCLAVLPLLFEYILRPAKGGAKEKLISVFSFTVPLAAGAFAVMWYNAARFGSPFEFGSSYQLTVSDISKNKIDPSMFFDSIYHFFFQLPEPKREFPFVSGSYLRPTYDRYFYYARTVGAVSFGLPIALLAAPFVCRIKKDPAKFATVFLSVALAIFVAFFDYCYAGVDLRYLIDFLPLITLVAAVILLSIHKNAAAQGDVCFKGIATAATLALCAIAVLMTLGITKMNTSSLIFPFVE
jgi:hypothetical protein